MLINKETIYFYDNVVEFEIYGSWLVGTIEEIGTAQIKFELSEIESDIEAPVIMSESWEQINDELTQIYFGDDTQTDRNIINGYDFN